MEWGRRNPVRLDQNLCEMPQPKTRFWSDGAACLTGAGLIQNGTSEAWVHVEWVGLWNIVIRQMVQESLTLISSPELPYTVVASIISMLQLNGVRQPKFKWWFPLIAQLGELGKALDL